MIANKLVKDYMTTFPVTVGPNAKLPDARYLMKSHKIRRLPVVEEGELVGIVTLTDLLEAAPSEAISLKAWEVSELTKQITVQKTMTLRPKTVSPAASLADAARMMLENTIGALPVVDDDRRLVGILTESDIFKAVATNTPSR